MTGVVLWKNPDINWFWLTPELGQRWHLWGHPSPRLPAKPSASTQLFTALWNFRFRYLDQNLHTAFPLPEIFRLSLANCHCHLTHRALPLPQVVCTTEFFGAHFASICLALIHQKGFNTCAVHTRNCNGVWETSLKNIRKQFIFTFSVLITQLGVLICFCWFSCVSWAFTVVTFATLYQVGKVILQHYFALFWLRNHASFKNKVFSGENMMSIFALWDLRLHPPLLQSYLHKLFLNFSPALLSPYPHIKL